VASQLKCRGQVTATTKIVTYEVEIKEIGYRPEPFVIVDALMYADGKPIVDIGNMSLRMSGLTRESVESQWRDSRGATPRASHPAIDPRRSPRKPAIFDYDRIHAFAVGKPSDAFGEPYRIFDEGRVIARLPGPPYQFLDRITAIRGEPWKMVAGADIEAEYDVPDAEWYFGANRCSLMPFAVLLEVALQPCGWLAAYLGSALTSDKDLKFRNLGGKAVQHRPVGPDIGTLTTQVKITQVSRSGGMIIQHYSMAMRSAAGPVYDGTTYFGFFSKEALANQVGIREATPYQPTDQEASRGQQLDYPDDAAFPDQRLRMIDRIDLFVPDGGPHGLGFIRGRKRVDPAEWFFKAHFYQDPVCPGSLGLESFLQLLRVVAVKRWGADTDVQAMACGHQHEWVYRGQVIPTDREVTVQAEIRTIDDRLGLIRADGWLSVDGRLIYQMKDFAVQRVEPGDR
jgi:3-hydroxymyristoyl/3-hydroxydecanoyl-(acyl carrier protein) dehydratase